MRSGLTMVALLAVCGWSTVRVEATGSMPRTTKVGLSTRNPDLFHPFARALALRPVRIVEIEDAELVVWAMITRGIEGAKPTEPRNSWVRGGNTPSSQGGGGLWFEFGRETESESAPAGRGAGGGGSTTLVVAVESRVQGRIVWSGRYRDLDAPQAGEKDWASWLERAASALVQRMGSEQAIGR